MRAFRKKIETLSAGPRVLISIGALEQEVPTIAPPGMELEAIKARVREERMVDAAREFADDLRDAELPDVRFVEFDGEEHGSVLAAAVGRAITFTLRRS